MTCFLLLAKEAYLYQLCLTFLLLLTHADHSMLTLDLLMLSPIVDIFPTGWKQYVSLSIYYFSFVPEMQTSVLGRILLAMYSSGLVV